MKKHILITSILSSCLSVGLQANILHSFEFADAASTNLQDSVNTGSIGGAFGAFFGGTPANLSATTTGTGALRLTYNGSATESRLTTGYNPLPTDIPLFQTVTINGWEMPAPDGNFGSTTQPQLRISFLNVTGTASASISSELRFTRQSSGLVNFDVVTGTTILGQGSLAATLNEPLTFVTAFDRPDGIFSVYQLGSNSSWTPLVVDQALATTGGVTRDALSTRIWLTGAVSVNGVGFVEIGDLSVSTVNPIPEPQTYALLAAFACLASVIYRRRRNSKG